MNTFSFAGIPFFSGTPSAASAHCNKLITNNQKGYVCFADLHGVTEAINNKHVMRAFKSASIVVPDGMPLVWTGKLFGYLGTKRIYGPDFMRTMCAVAQQNNYAIFLYGTTKKTLQKLVHEIKKNYPKVRINGTYAPPFHPLTPSQKQKVIDIINNSGAKIVFVGISTPKQELWMYEMAPRIDASLLLGVGAAFDFLAHTKKQAPAWVRSMGLEWLYRLIHEPRRLWKRYFVSCITFLKFVILPPR